MTCADYLESQSRDPETSSPTRDATRRAPGVSGGRPAVQEAPAVKAHVGYRVRRAKAGRGSLHPRPAEKVFEFPNGAITPAPAGEGGAV